MAIKHQICIICGAENPLEARTCALCGARLTGKPAQSAPHISPSRSFYDFSLGEDDLMTQRGTVGWWIFALVLSLLCVGLLAGALRLMFRPDTIIEIAANFTFTPDVTQTILAQTPSATLTPSLTRTPPPPLPTVTLTFTPTPTLGPCEFTVQEGDSLILYANQCGYPDYNTILGEILALNELPSAASLQIGQVIQVPRPTATTDLSLLAQGEDVAELSAEEIIANQQAALEPTLDPNLQWHQVQLNETLIDIVASYNIDVKLLSEINPEVEFPQCDFGQQFGGPTCYVILYEGQRLRVPAPTPTATIPPTSSGNETATPTATATINIPQAISPEDNANFEAANVVTVRWSTTGTLGQDEVYVVHVRNMATEEEFMGVTCDLAFDLPPQWQPQGTNEFQPYEWWMTIADASPFGTGQDNFVTRFSGLSLCKLSFDPPINWEQTVGNILDLGLMTDFRLGDERFPTVPRRFNWQGRG